MFRYFHAPRLRQAGRLLPFSLLLVLVAVAGLASSAGAAPLSSAKPTRTPGLTPATNCSSNPGGDLDARITDHPDHTTAVFTNSSRDCSYHIGLATYKKVDDNIDHQIFFAGQTAVIAPNSTMTLQVGNPSCAYQGDAFWGRMLTSLAGGVRYNERLLDDTDGVNSVYCIVEATATPTRQAVPPSATATAAAPSATATATAAAPSATATAALPSATATDTAVPPTNTPTNTPTPGAQKVRPTNTPTAIPAGASPSPTATETAVAAPPMATETAVIVVAPPTATETAVAAPPPATATAVVVPPTSTPAPGVAGSGAPPTATATNTPVSTVRGSANPPAPPASAPSAGAPPAPASGGQGTAPVSRVGPLVGANNGPAPAELPPTGTADLAWTLWLALAGLVLGSGLLLRHAARQRAS